MTHAAPAPRRRRRARGHAPIAASVGIALIALALIAYILRPRWPVEALPADVPTLPVTIGGVAFSIPPGAFRIAVQRRVGAQPRVDLAFRWPSLEVPEATDVMASPMADRIFLTIAEADGTPDIGDRARSLYQRYLTPGPPAAAGQLVTVPFKPDSPYAGEDLVFMQGQTPQIAFRCSRPGAGGTPGTCLHDQNLRGANLTFRLSRDALADWGEVESGINRLLEQLVRR